MNEPFFTIVVPTRDRAETLQYTLMTCLQQEYDRFEIIVSDNNSSDHTRSVVERFSADERVRYINPGRRLSMTGNFEFALSHVHGPGFVIFIGDDDGLMFGALERAAALINEHKVLALVCNSIFYAWPNFPVGSLRNSLVVRSQRRFSEVRNSRGELEKLLRFDGLERNYVWGLPGIYRSFVHTSVIESAKVDGKYFHSITPDAYSALVNALILDRFLFTSESLTIEGVSGQSNGASQMYGISKVEEEKFIRENDMEFHPRLAYGPSPTIVLGEAYLRVADAFPEETADLTINLQNMCISAMNSAFGPNAPRVADAVEKIFEINKIPYPVHSRSQKWSFRRIAVRLREAYSSTSIDCVQADISNVLDAASIFASGVAYNRALARTGYSRVFDEIIRKVSALWA